MRLNLRTVRIGLSPTSLEMAVFDWRGRPLRAERFAVEDGHGWKETTAALRAQLQNSQWKAGAAQIVLSSHFVRHCMLPAELSRSNAVEQAAYVRHVFRAEYGDAVDGWRIATDQAASRARLACAIDASLFDELAAACRDAGTRLRSVLPCLAAAANAGRATIRQSSAWVAILESNLCVAGLLESGRWAHIARLRLPRISGAALLRLVEEQEVVLGRESAVRTLYVGGAARDLLEDADLSGWTIDFLPAAVTLPRPLSS